MKNKIFKFKNKRKYIHGTDIFNFLISKKTYKLIDIKFVKPLTSQPKICSTIPSYKKIAVIANIVNKSREKKFFLINTKKKIHHRYFVNEELPIKSFRINNKSALFENLTAKSSIEILVSLTKFFHQKKIAKKNWLFTRIILKKNFKNILKKKFKIKLEQNYKNISTISKIYENNKLIGKINFSVK